MGEIPIIDKERVFSQKNLWQILSLYQRSFPPPFPAFVQAALAFALCMAVFIPSTFFAPRDFHLQAEHYVKLIAVVSQASLATAVGLLSVAIAGFAIFASGFDTKIAIPLLTRIKKNVGVPPLVFIFSFFVYTLMTLFFLVVASIGLIAISSENTVFTVLLKRALGEHLTLFFLLISAAQFSQIIFAISIIKSFVWNLYETLLSITAARVDAELKARRREAEESKKA